MLCLSAEEDEQEEEANRQLAEGGAANPSGLVWPAHLPHRPGRFDSLQPGGGQHHSAAAATVLGPVTKVSSTVTVFGPSDHHGQGTVSR